ncbi:hypothetical protein [Gimesia aquarii]|uniref:PIN domain-containing protein n=1 Tax=Gimesia aquarii TaxID=2527964 RepID=A0A517X192_9PLAN|nr:hypothetical protein [Gimesia aquarii]QDU11275.1 hypothetical protein V202x_46940 [Gimesia aquarii]
MPDSVLHVVLDANILSDFLYKKSTKAQERVPRSNNLIAAVMKSNWPRIKLYTPAICIAETLGIIDKYRFASWKGEFRSDPSILLTQDDYEEIRDTLFSMVNSGVLEQLEHEPKHALMSSVISPVNCDFNDESEGNKTIMMGATDCVIIGMATHLTSRLGEDSVILVTGDSRMAKVTKLAKKLSHEKAEELGITSNAKKLGIKWNNEIYPEVINLSEATDSELKIAFGGWPLPNSKISYQKKSDSTLKKSEKDELNKIWEEIKVQKEYRIWNFKKNELTEPTIDKLPYTKAIDAIQIQYAIKHGVYLMCKDISWSLLNRRKANKPSEPKSHVNEQFEQGSLFKDD